MIDNVVEITVTVLLPFAFYAAAIVLVIVLAVELVAFIWRALE
jgi:hypothetical protein